MLTTTQANLDVGAHRVYVETAGPAGNLNFFKLEVTRVLKYGTTVTLEVDRNAKAGPKVKFSAKRVLYQVCTKEQQRYADELKSLTKLIPAARHLKSKGAVSKFAYLLGYALDAEKDPENAAQVAWVSAAINKPDAS
jgi:hypothetical protein